MASPMKPMKVGEMRADRVLADRRVDADREGDGPDEQQRRDRQHQRQPHALVDQRLRPAGSTRSSGREIAAEDDVGDPLPVLDVERLTQPVALAHAVDEGLVHLHAFGRHAGHHRAQVVARRQLDDDEGQDGDEEQRHHHVAQASQQICEHAAASPRTARPRGTKAAGAWVRLLLDVPGGEVERRRRRVDRRVDHGRRHVAHPVGGDARRCR